MRSRQPCARRLRTQRIRDRWFSSFEPEDELNALFSRASPNPERLGCLSVSDLRTLARRTITVEDVRYSHLARCSPCFRECRGLQQNEAVVAAIRERVGA